jgi:YD repeat-containing protein
LYVITHPLEADMTLRRAHAIGIAVVVCVIVNTIGVPTQTSGAAELPKPQLRPLRQAGSPGDIAYVYDPVGQLRAVVDPASSTAQYTYDPVGNITSIHVFSSVLTSLVE